jgi:dienelactone hydrolase
MPCIASDCNPLPAAELYVAAPSWQAGSVSIGPADKQLPFTRSKEMVDVGRKPLNLYGSLQTTMDTMRRHRPMDLSAAVWRENHPDGTFNQWRAAAQSHLRQSLHYDPREVNLKARTLARMENPKFICERIEFNTAPWFRVPGYFYIPKGTPLPAPALIVMHEWGGPMLFGADRVCGDPMHDIIREHREIYTSGRALADFFASRGYCVICIDAYHFGSRAPRGLHGIPESIDLRALKRAALDQDQMILSQTLIYLGVRQLNWAGTTWAGVNFGDDSRCVDYLLSRPEVRAEKIGVTGLSGGGWRTNMLAALDDRIAAAVPVGWMTTGDAQQAYNIEGAIGAFRALLALYRKTGQTEYPWGSASAVPFPKPSDFDAQGKKRFAQRWNCAISSCPRAGRIMRPAPRSGHCIASCGIRVNSLVCTCAMVRQCSLIHPITACNRGAALRSVRPPAQSGHMATAAACLMAGMNTLRWAPRATPLPT